jgi:hypothetical protein
MPHKSPIKITLFYRAFAIFAALTFYTERCQSGSMCLIRNQVYCQRYRGFESLSLRKSIALPGVAGQRTGNGGDFSLPQKGINEINPFLSA